MPENIKILLNDSFFENFESGEIDDIAARWSEARNPEGKVISFSNEVPPGSAGRRSLVMTATRGENEGGHLYKAFEVGWDKIHLRFYTKFAEDHGYHHHFAALRGFIWNTENEPATNDTIKKV